MLNFNLQMLSLWKTNEVKAFYFYKQAARKGNNMAQNSLGVLYENGKGIGNSLETAIYWYHQAAKSGIMWHNIIWV